MRRVLVTGAGGFIGTVLIHKLIASGAIVTALSREIPRQKYKKCKYISADLQDEKKILSLPNDIDVIFHTAAHIPNSETKYEDNMLFSTNVVGTQNLLKLAIKNNIKHFIYSSSISVYGSVTKGSITEDVVQIPSSLYGLSKKFAEEIIRFYGTSFQLPYTILRYSSVYGPGMKYNTVLPLFFQKALVNKDITIMGTGERSQDFVHIEDVVQANLSVWEEFVTGTYLVGSGKETSLTQLAESILTILPQSSSEIIYKPTENEDKQRVYCNITKAKKAFRYKPKYMLRDGLRTML